MHNLDLPTARNEVVLMTPRYDYKCPNCETAQTIVHDFHSQDPQTCPQCKNLMQKQISLPAVHFKGSGFYKTDNK